MNKAFKKIVKKAGKKALAAILCVLISMSCFSITAFMVSDTELENALNTAKSYIDALTVNNSSNVPSKVVSTFGTQFTWDNEKRETANKSYLFEWSYYNGVVFEGLEYIYEETQDSTYRSYVEDYMSAMIKSDGSWATTSNNSAKECAGYVDYHGADCYKTASLLLDMAKKSDGTIDTTSKYYKTAQTLYYDLTEGTGSNYIDSSVGNNYWHGNWNSTTAPTYKVWLDGLYMIQPFLAEYAYYAGDTAVLDTIVSRFQWIYDNVRAADTGLYYHALNSSSDVCAYHWTRAIGWYAMAIVDVMQYMSGSNLEAMTVILKDLVDNMLVYQDSATGMWANLCDKSVTSTNRLETSGTAMMAYAIARGVNKGWLDSSYIQYAKDAFAGMVSNKLTSDGLTDIYFKASASGSNVYETSNYYYTNEGKGVGPFIMAYAQVLEAVNNENEIPLNNFTDSATGVVIADTTATAISVTDVSSDATIVAAFADVATDFRAYDIKLSDYTQGETVEVRMPVPDTFDSSKVVVYSVADDGTLTKIKSTVSSGYVVFSTDHFSVYAVAESTAEQNIDWVYVNTYQSTPVTIYVKYNGALQTGHSYLIGYTSNNSGAVINSSARAQSVTSKAAGETKYYSSEDGGTLYTASDEYIIGTEAIDNCVYTRSGTSLINDYSGKYLNRSGTSSVTTSTTSSTSWNFSTKLIYTTYNNRNRYLRYYNSAFSLSTRTSYYIYGYEKTTVYEVTGNADETGYYGLSGTLSYDVPLGSAFSESNILSQASVLFKSSETADASAVDWSSSNISYSWDSALNTAKPGVYNLNVYASDTKIGSVSVTVSQDDYPDFPNYGSVKIDKYAVGEGFNNTGVAEVDLSVTGVPNTKPIDVLFVADVSNSMSWVAGTTTAAGAGESSKLNDMQESVAAFSNAFLSNNTTGGSKNNTISFVTFAGLDKDHIQNSSSVTNFSSYTDSTRTLFIGSENPSDVASEVNKLTFSYENNNYYLSFDGSVDTSTDLNYGNTNYDYAFMQASEAISDIKTQYYNKTGINYESSDRQIYVIFVTDGAPTNYNGVYYAHPTSSTRPDYNATWINSSGSEVTYTLGNGGTAAYSQSAWYSYINTTDLYWATKVFNTASVMGMSSVGVDMAHGGFSSWQFTEEAGYSLKTVLEGLVTDNTIDTYLVDNQIELAQALLDRADSLKETGSNAYVIDTMGSEYDLQMAAYANCSIADGGKLALSDYGVTPKIRVSSYDTYNLSDVGTVIGGTTITTSMVGLRKSDTPTVKEEVTFNSDGTEAYSSLLSGNIMTDGVIYASYFTYNSTAESVTLDDGTVLPAESFLWRIGSIPEDDIVLSYYVYLTGSMEGECPAGTYDTNSQAVLYYKNYIGNDCEQIFPVPNLEWGDAKLNYELYLVDSSGNPIDESGNAVSFENRKQMSELQTLEKYLNTATVIDFDVLASLIPSGYGLYNPNATYTGVIASGDDMSKSAVSDTSGTTIVYSPSGAVVGSDGTVSGITDYTNVYVAFAIVKTAINPDVIVVDYGKSITSHPLENDNGVYSLAGIAQIDSGLGTALVSTVTGNNGVFKVEGNNIVYSPFKYMSSIDRVMYCVSSNGEEVTAATSLSSTVTVIPATTVYYEDNFGGDEANGGLYINYTGDWFTVSDDGTKTSGITANTDTTDRQDNGEVGQGNTPYGHDSSYADDIQFSNGTAAQATGSVSLVNGRPQFDASASFEFTGTGFDIISRTDLDCGMITVYIVDSNGKATNVPVINKGSNTLYQIPVISYTGLDYGTYTVTINVNAPVTALGITGSVFYLDAIRIYDPMGTSSADNSEFAEANAAYNTDHEANAYVASIRDYILQAGKLDETETYGAVWVDTINNDYDGGGFIEQSSIKDFELTGPNEEVYLSPGYGIGFIVESTSIPDSVQLEIKVPAPLKNGARLSVQTIGESNVTNFDVTSATEMFYDISDAVVFTPTTVNGTTLYRATVILANGLPSEDTSEIVSITNIKMTYDDAKAVLSTDSVSELTLDAETVEELDETNTEAVALKASWNVYVDVFDTVYTQHQASLPEYSVSSAETDGTVKSGQTVKATVKTSRYVDALTVTDEYGSQAKITNVTSSVDESKILTEEYKTAKTWNIEFTAYGSNGTKEYTVSSANGEGETAQLDVEIKNPTVESIKVYTKPNKTSYYYGESFDPTGMTLLVTYSDSTTKVIDSGYSVSPEKFTKTGSQKVTVTYGGKETTLSVKVRYSMFQFITGILGFGWLWK